jgi:hypothetical protein
VVLDDWKLRAAEVRLAHDAQGQSLNPQAMPRLPIPSGKDSTFFMLRDALVPNLTQSNINSIYFLRGLGSVARAAR